MSFAIVQKDLVVPDVEQLKRAFSVSPYLRDIDAQNAANDAHGILLRGVESKQADALQAALQAEGVETELVRESALPPIPTAKVARRMEFTSAHLVVFDTMDRSSEISWDQIMFIAAGYVRMGKAQKHRGAVEEAQARHFAGPLNSKGGIKTGEEAQYHMLLDIFLSGGSVRYSMAADEFLYDCLGSRASNDLAMDFVLLVQELSTNAPNAGLNRGGCKACEDPPELLPYPSKAAFNEEITWMLWRIAKLRA